MLRGITRRLDVLREVFAFLWRRKLWWLIPFAILLIAFIGLLILAQGSGVAPFLYPLF